VNIPNSLTIARFVLSVIFFVLIGFRQPIIKDLALLTFALAGLTDLLDGYFARRHSTVTIFGRIADPFVDKILICGAFILFIGQPQLGVEKWMVIVIVAREFMVSGLRGFAESQGVPFGATFLGKAKMAVQFSTVCILILFSAHLSTSEWADSLLWIVHGAMWITVLVTLFSGLAYIHIVVTKGLLSSK
jgi:CDP-diacylglycerol--glycerol-3-phosphate 3-phosphatidyltransferase